MIAIIGAMEIEVEALKKRLDVYEEKMLHGIKIMQGEVHEQSLVVALSGVGKVSAAMCTTMLLTAFDIEYVINIGTAGGLNSKQKVLDLVIANDIVQHDFDTTGLDGEAGRGVYAHSDPQLIQRALPLLEMKRHQVWLGTVASGDTFVYNEEQVAYLKKHFKDLVACEMEAGAIADVCNHFDIPCIILRSLSDNACCPNSEMDFLSYAALASERSAQFCVDFIEK